MNLKAWSGQVVLRVSCDDELPLPPMRMSTRHWGDVFPSVTCWRVKLELLQKPALHLLSWMSCFVAKVDRRS
jgi:hypothetical protein